MRIKSLTTFFTLSLALSICLTTACSCNGSHVNDPARQNDGKKTEKEDDQENKNDNSTSEVTTPPATITQWLAGKESPLDKWYQKYVDCDGLPILSSSAVRDTSLLQARYIARTMLSRIPEAREEMIKCHFRIGVVGYKENITDLPECKMMKVWWPDTDWDARGRGYGATLDLPVMSIGEENLVEVPGFKERYYSESIMVHEFAHNVDFAMRRVNPEFGKALDAAFEHAQKTGLFKGTYFMENAAEYFAEGTQAWYNTCRITIKTREDLKSYDRMLYDVCASVYSEEVLHGYHFD